MHMEVAATRRLADLSENKSQNISALKASRYVRFGEFVLDVQRQDLIQKGERIRIPGKVCQVLVALLEQPGGIVTREDLRGRLWASDTHVNFDANVNTTVNKLRQMLGDSNERSVYVQTIPRKGYSFISDVEFVAEPEIVRDDGGEMGDGDVSATKATEGTAAMGFGLFAANRSLMWFTAGVIALTIAAILLGAAITLFSYHHS